MSPEFSSAQLNRILVVHVTNSAVRQTKVSLGNEEPWIALDSVPALTHRKELNLIRRSDECSCPQRHSR